MRQRFYLEVFDKYEPITSASAIPLLATFSELAGKDHEYLQTHAITRTEQGYHYAVVQYTLDCDVPVQFDFGILVKSDNPTITDVVKLSRSSVIQNINPSHLKYWQAPGLIIGRLNIGPGLVAGLDLKFITKK